MGLFRKMKEWCKENDDYLYDYDDMLDNYQEGYEKDYDIWNHNYDKEILGKVNTIMTEEMIPPFKVDLKQASEEERNHCLKLYELANGFDELDAATIMCVLCDKYMNIVLNAVGNKLLEMQDTLTKYKTI